MKRVIIHCIIVAIATILSVNSVHANDFEAKAVAVIDDNGNILYAQNKDLKLEPASTTKLLTVLVALERLDPYGIITVSSRVSKVPTCSPTLNAGERLTVADTIRLALVKSSNQAASALAEAVSGNDLDFAGLMNQKAKEIGATHSHFVTPSGLPGGTQYTTAYDLALIVRDASKNKSIADAIAQKTVTIQTLDGRIIEAENTNKLINEPWMVGGKTGFTNKARNCFAFVAREADKTMYGAVLGSPRRPALWSDAITLERTGGAVVSGQRKAEIISAAVKGPLVKVKKLKRRIHRV